MERVFYRTVSFAKHPAGKSDCHLCFVMGRISSIQKIAEGTCDSIVKLSTKSHMGTMWDFARVYPELVEGMAMAQELPH